MLQQALLLIFDIPKAQILILRIELMKILTKIAKLTNYTNFDFFNLDEL